MTTPDLILYGLLTTLAIIGALMVCDHDYTRRLEATIRRYNGRYMHKMTRWEVLR